MGQRDRHVSLIVHEVATVAGTAGSPPRVRLSTGSRPEAAMYCKQYSAGSPARAVRKTAAVRPAPSTGFSALPAQIQGWQKRRRGTETSGEKGVGSTGKPRVHPCLRPWYTLDLTFPA